MPVHPRLPRVEAGVQRVIMLSHHVAGACAHFAAYGLDMHTTLVSYDSIAPTASTR